MAGLVSNIQRKNIESIAYLHEQDRQPLQKFIGQKPWEWQPMIAELVAQIAATIGRSRRRAGDRSVGSHQARQGVGGRGAAMVRACGQSGQLPSRRVLGLRHA